jgi:hypothetical protein
MSALDDYNTREGRVLAAVALGLLRAAQAYEDADPAGRGEPADA